MHDKGDKNGSETEGIVSACSTSQCDVFFLEISLDETRSFPLKSYNKS